MSEEIKWQRIVLTECARGATILCTHLNDPTKKHSNRYHLSDGRQIKTDLAERMIADGLLLPNNDGLFGDSQSYRMARGEELK